MEHKHNWKKNQEIGMKENPGVISRDGYIIHIHTVCECGKKRVEEFDTDPNIARRKKSKFNYYI